MYCLLTVPFWRFAWFLHTGKCCVYLVYFSYNIYKSRYHLRILKNISLKYSKSKLASSGSEFFCLHASWKLHQQDARSWRKMKKIFIYYMYSSLITLYEFVWCDEKNDWLTFYIGKMQVSILLQHKLQFPHLLSRSRWRL